MSVSDLIGQRTPIKLTEKMFMETDTSNIMISTSNKPLSLLSASEFVVVRDDEALNIHLVGKPIDKSKRAKRTKTCILPKLTVRGINYATPREPKTFAKNKTDTDTDNDNEKQNADDYSDTNSEHSEDYTTPPPMKKSQPAKPTKPTKIPIVKDILSSDDEVDEVVKTTKPTVTYSSDDEDTEQNIKPKLTQTIEYKVDGVAIANSPTFWDNYIDCLHWTDRDESVRTAADVTNRLSAKKRAELKAALLVLIKPLRDGLNIPEFNNLTAVQQNDFLAHIVGKGKNFYDVVITCPTMALYLLENVTSAKKPRYQNLMSFL